MKICARCQEVIRPGEPYDSHDKFSSSAGGIVIYIHRVCPKE
ncbi:hypothetical protein [Streptomyces antibioticus]